MKYEILTVLERKFNNEFLRQQLIVNRAGCGIRLDKLLSNAFPDRSRAYFQRLIDNGHVLFNEKPVYKASLNIPPGGKVKVVLSETKIIDLAPHPIEIELIDQREDFLVINKPVGLAVHPSISNPHELTLVNGLLYKFPEIAQLGDRDRPGIVHRLDKGASGLMLVARTQRGYTQLVELFKNRKITKRYEVVVAGQPSREDEIDSPIGRHPIHRQKMACNGIAAKPAHTRYQVSLHGKTWSLLNVWPTTGRTHQIRVHLAQLGYPVLGDETYGSTESKRINVNRLMLHAAQLTFEYDGQGENYRIDPCWAVPDYDKPKG